MEMAPKAKTEKEALDNEPMPPVDDDAEVAASAPVEGRRDEGDDSEPPAKPPR
jgi:hypothetical protein